MNIFSGASGYPAIGGAPLGAFGNGSTSAFPPADLPDSATLLPSFGGVPGYSAQNNMGKGIMLDLGVNAWSVYPGNLYMLPVWNGMSDPDKKDHTTMYNGLTAGDVHDDYMNLFFVHRHGEMFDQAPVPHLHVGALNFILARNAYSPELKLDEYQIRETVKWCGVAQKVAPTASMVSLDQLGRQTPGKIRTVAVHHGSVRSKFYWALNPFCRIKAVGRLKCFAQTFDTLQPGVVLHWLMVPLPKRMRHEDALDHIRDYITALSEEDEVLATRVRQTWGRQEPMGAFNGAGRKRARVTASASADFAAKVAGFMRRSEAEGLADRVLGLYFPSGFRPPLLGAALTSVSRSEHVQAHPEDAIDEAIAIASIVIQYLGDEVPYPLLRQCLSHIWTQLPEAKRQELRSQQAVAEVMDVVLGAAASGRKRERENEANEANKANEELRQRVNDFVANSDVGRLVNYAWTHHLKGGVNRPTIQAALERLSKQDAADVPDGSVTSVIGIAYIAYQRFEDVNLFPLFQKYLRRLWEKIPLASRRRICEVQQDLERVMDVVLKYEAAGEGAVTRALEELEADAPSAQEEEDKSIEVPSRDGPPLRVALHLDAQSHPDPLPRRRGWHSHLTGAAFPREQAADPDDQDEVVAADPPDSPAPPAAAPPAQAGRPPAAAPPAAAPAAQRGRPPAAADPAAAAHWDGFGPSGSVYCTEAEDDDALRFSQSYCATDADARKFKILWRPRAWQLLPYVTWGGRAVPEMAYQDPVRGMYGFDMVVGSLFRIARVTSRDRGNVARVLFPGDAGTGGEVHKAHVSIGVADIRVKLGALCL